MPKGVVIIAGCTQGEEILQVQGQIRLQEKLCGAPRQSWGLPRRKSRPEEEVSHGSGDDIRMGRKGSIL